MADEKPDAAPEPKPDGAAAPDAAVPAVAAEEPKRHQHSQRVLRVAAELGIAPEEAELMDSVALRQEIADAQLEFQVRSSRRQQSPIAAPALEPQEPDEEYQFPVEIRDELASADPAILKAIKHLGKEAVRGRKAQEEIKRLRQEQANRDLHQQVARVLDGLPVPGGSRESRDRAVFVELAELERRGELADVPVAQAVAKAYRNLYGGTPAAAREPRGPAATPTARPTNRLAPEMQGTLDHLNGNSADDFVP